MTDLSVLIPSRNEQFLRRTIEDVLANIEGDTEIIAVLDGAWADPPLEQNDRVHVIYNHEPVGQRAATNQAARVSAARYLMKLDAHCALGPGFDSILVEQMDGHEDWTIVPTMYNLHAFDWLCPNGHRRYQGPSGPCAECGEETEMDVLWQAKRSPETTAMRFDRDLRFQYWSGYKQRQIEDEHGVVETMSLLGACWMLTRERYFSLDICDEAHGSWGQQGTEVACKTWLSGGRLVVSRRTWFAHMFRTQGGDFGFPYDIHGSDIQRARDRSKSLWIGGNWPLAKHNLPWLIERFAPVEGWETSSGIVYYTDNRAPVKLAKNVQQRIAAQGLPIVAVSLKPMPQFTANIVLDLDRGPLTMFRQILAGLEASTADHIFFCEHDVLYHPSHFEFVPPRDDRFFYNTNVWKARDDGFCVRTVDCRQTSGLCASRELLLEHYRKRVEIVERDGFTRRMGFEPGTHRRKERVDDYRSETWESEFPNIDIRHGGNLTQTRWSPEEYRDKRHAKGWQEAQIEELPGWSNLRALVQAGTVR